MTEKQIILEVNRIIASKGYTNKEAISVTSGVGAGTLYMMQKSGNATLRTIVKLLNVLGYELVIRAKK